MIDSGLRRQYDCEKLIRRVEGAYWMRLSGKVGVVAVTTYTGFLGVQAV